MILSHLANNPVISLQNQAQSNKVYLNDTLSLKVDYTNLQEECEEYVSQEIIHQLERIKLVKYWYLIKDVIVSKLTFDLNGFAVYKTIRFLNGLELNLLAERIIFAICGKLSGSEEFGQINDEFTCES